MERPASFGAGETEKPSGANARRSASLLFTLSAHLRRRARPEGLHGRFIPLRSVRIRLGSAPARERDPIHTAARPGPLERVCEELHA
jgi:hypothetical protein